MTLSHITQYICNNNFLFFLKIELKDLETFYDEKKTKINKIKYSKSLFNFFQIRLFFFFIQNCGFFTKLKNNLILKLLKILNK